MTHYSLPPDTSEKKRVRPYTLLDLSRLYKISKPTLRKRLIPLQEEMGLRIGNYYNPRQIRIIFEKLGTPHLLNA